MSRSVLFVGMVVSLGACATSGASINSFTDPSLKPEAIRSLAVFPIVNGRFAPSEAQTLNRQISMGINQRNPNITLMSPAEATSKLNEKGLANDWAVFLSNYNSSGVPDAATLKRIGAALGVDAILQGEIDNVRQIDGQFGVNKGMTRVTVRFTILGCQEGKLLWDASSDGTASTATTLDKAPPLLDAIGPAIDKILENLPL